MRSTIKYIKFVLLGAIALVGFITTRSEAKPAQHALNNFFDQLIQGNYAEAAKLYGGSYEYLVEFNPEVKADDLATLWKNGCQINGFQCIPIRTVEFIEENPDGVFVFNVEFTGPDGNLFILQPCCGEEVTNMEPMSLFAYHVLKTEDGNYLVYDMPVYVP